MNNIKELLLKLLNSSKVDEDLIKNYLKDKNIDNLFKDYKGLDISEETKEQIESLIIIIENHEAM